MALYQQICVDPEHPVAQMFGHRGRRGRPRVYKHKFVLYEKLGPGSHPCHWCGAPLEWRRGTGAGTLLADHLDGDATNNDPANLVPACNGCNTIRARTRFRAAIQTDELAVTARDGTRTRGADLTCEMCGQPFVAAVARVKRKTASTCSKACAGRKGALSRWGR